MLVYFDLNIFDQIEKIERLDKNEKEGYQTLQDLVLQEKIVVPYSNAHLNDLFRGFLKNPDYIDGHLKNIERLTNNLCICQYWNREKVTWHYRDIHEFFDEKKNEREFDYATVGKLFSEIGLLAIIEPFKHLV